LAIDRKLLQHDLLQSKILLMIVYSAKQSK
jgi:hypothetical protein